MGPLGFVLTKQVNDILLRVREYTSVQGVVLCSCLSFSLAISTYFTVGLAMHTEN